MPRSPPPLPTRSPGFPHTHTHTVMERLVVDLVLDSDRLSSLIARSNELLTTASVFTLSADPFRVA